MNYSSKTKLLKNKLEEEITNGVKKRISQLDLIDTGKMINTFGVEISFEDDGLDIEFSTTKYFKYVDGNYNITNYVLESKKIKSLMDEVFGMMIDDMFMED